jgi:hypothetical protein
MVKGDKVKQGDLSKYTDGWEPFVTNNGEFGFALPYYKQDGIKTASEWVEALRGSQEDRDVPAALEVKFRNLPRSIQKASTCPILEEDPDLLDDLIAFIKRHVWIPEEGYYTVLASWAIDTWIHDFMETSPRLIFFATTRSGKTRALNTLRELSYHGLDMSSPTQATMFRLIEAFHPSLFIDEYQDLHQDVMPLIGSIFKLGFQEGGEVPRCDDDQDRTVRFFSVYSPIAIGLKNHEPKEDELNRSIMVRMLTKPSNMEIERIIQKDAAKVLRGRLLGLRFKVLIGMINLEPLKKEASILAMREIPGKDKPIKLDDRSMEIAAALLVPSLVIGGRSKETKIGSILGMVANSQAFSDDGLKDTNEGKAFSAVQAVYQCQDMLEQTGIDGRKMHSLSKMTTREVAAQYNSDLSEQGDDDRRDVVKTGRVTSMIKSLGFRLKRGPHNQTFFDPDLFMSVYEVNLRKYGERVN